MILFALYTHSIFVSIAEMRKRVRLPLPSQKKGGGKIIKLYKVLSSFENLATTRDTELALFWGSGLLIQC